VQRNEIISLLKEKKYGEIIERAIRPKEVFRILIGISYDKTDVLCWRAIELAGLLAGELSKKYPDLVRNVAQRLLWMMREESGNNPWSAPEMLGEIVRNAPAGFADIAPVIASFHDEKMLRPGVLRAIFRVGELRPDLIGITEDFVRPYLRDSDATVRIYALLIAGAYGLKELDAAAGEMQSDSATVTLYEAGELLSVSVGQVAEEVHQRLSRGELNERT
jgi:hypothetical protein